jgi:hypothetical protein
LEWGDTKRSGCNNNFIPKIEGLPQMQKIQIFPIQGTVCLFEIFQLFVWIQLRSSTKIQKLSKIF